MIVTLTVWERIKLSVCLSTEGVCVCVRVSCVYVVCVCVCVCACVWPPTSLNAVCHMLHSPLQLLQRRGAQTLHKSLKGKSNKNELKLYK